MKGHWIDTWREEAATPLIMRWGGDREGGAAGPPATSRWFSGGDGSYGLIGYWAHRLTDSADMVHTELMVVCSTGYIDWRWLLSCLQSIIFGPVCGCWCIKGLCHEMNKFLKIYYDKYVLSVHALIFKNYSLILKILQRPYSGDFDTKNAYRK